jgi:hypothetical protein
MATVTARVITTNGVVGNNTPMPVKDFGPASFRALFTAIVPAQNKYMAVLFNTNTDYNVEVHRIFLVHDNITAATGIVLAQSLIRVSAFTTGTAVTPVAMDPGADTLPSGISADHNSSAVSDVASSTIANIVALSEEVILTTTDVFMGVRAAFPQGVPVFLSGNGIKPLVLRGATAACRGIAMKNITSSTAGSCTYCFDFNVVPI